MHKKLAFLLVAASIMLPATFITTQAAPIKASRIHKSRIKKTKSVDTPAKISTSGMYADKYYCEMGKNFTLYRYPDNKDSVILDWAGTKRPMYKKESVTHAERYETTAKLTFIGAANLTQLIDFKAGKPVLTECRNNEQMKIQAEMNKKKAINQTAKKNKNVFKTSI